MTMSKELTKLESHYLLCCHQLEVKLEKAEGALEMALEHLGYVGADHDGFCNDKYGCNVYGDEEE